MKPKDQLTAVIVTFEDRREAEGYLAALKTAGFKDDEIGLVVPHHEAGSVEAGAVTGALTGGALGAFAGAAATGLVPGIGPVLAGGLLAGVLGGAAAGAAAGSLLGALVGMGVPEEEAQQYEQEFLAGRSLVVVQAVGRGAEALALARHFKKQYDRLHQQDARLVKDVMTTVVATVHPDTSLQEAAERMKTLDVGPLPVCEGNRIVGMVTDRDITIRATADSVPPRLGKVRDVMTTNVVACYEDQNLHEAAELMKDKQIRRLVVLNRDGDLVGIISLGDVAVATGDDQFAGAILEKVSEPT